MPKSRGIEEPWSHCLPAAIIVDDGTNDVTPRSAILERIAKSLHLEPHTANRVEKPVRASSTMDAVSLTQEWK